MLNERATRVPAPMFTLIAACAFCLGSRPVCAGASIPAPAQSGSEAAHTSRDIDRLFADEMKSALTKLKWHGERLSQDTVYAIALTGASWEPAWGREQMFSLAWGDTKKVPALKRRGFRDREGVIANVRSLYLARQYRRAVDAATADFSLDEIGCDVNLKEYVGASLMALGQPEQAFPIYSAPFAPPPSEAKASEHNRKFREGALEAAISAGLRKEAIAFSFSLLLEPDRDLPRPDEKQIAYLQSQGVDVDRVMLGILQAPERMRGLPPYYYPAADLVALRATPRALPLLLQLAGSGDVYLRSRALLGLGMVAHQPRPNDPPGWWQAEIQAEPREYGISSAERRLIDKDIREGAASDHYRLRAVAALAMGLVGDPDYSPILQKLAKDRAYILVDESGGQSKSRRIYHPVRMAVSAALGRYGITVDPASGETLSGRDLDRAKRGGSDETNDRRSLRSDVPGTIMISPIDVTLNVREPE